MKKGGPNQKPSRHKKNFSFGYSPHKNQKESEIFQLLNKRTLKNASKNQSSKKQQRKEKNLSKDNKESRVNPFLQGEISSKNNNNNQDRNLKSPKNLGNLRIKKNSLEHEAYKEPLLQRGKNSQTSDFPFRKQSLQKFMTRGQSGSKRFQQSDLKRRKSSRRNSRVSNLYSSHFQEGKISDTSDFHTIIENDSIDSEILIFEKRIYPKSVRDKILRKVILTAIAIFCLSITFYIQFFHVEYLIGMELNYLPSVYDAASPYKKNFVFRMVGFLRSLYFVFPMIFVIICTFLKSESQSHILMSSYFLYSTLGVVMASFLSSKRPYWSLPLAQSDSVLCLRSFAHPETLLFDMLGFAYYVFAFQRKMKIRDCIRWGTLLTLLLFNFLVFFCLFVDGQIFLTQYMLMPGIFLADIIIVRSLKRVFETVFEGLSSQRENSKAARFYFTLGLFILLCIMQNFVIYQSSSERGMTSVTIAMECLSVQKQSQDLIYPNPSFDRIVGRYPLMMGSQGLIALFGMTLGLFVAHFVIVDHRFWFNFSKKLFLWRLGLTSFSVFLCLGRLYISLFLPIWNQKIISVKNFV